MIYTKAQIMDILEIEKEDNSQISRELLDETILWSERFSGYPDIKFNLEGNPEMFIPFLENNKIAIEQAVLRNKKLRRGPTPKPAEKIRKNCIGVYFTDVEFADIAIRAGTHIPNKQTGGDTASRRKIAAFIRTAVSGSLLATVPK